MAVATSTALLAAGAAGVAGSIYGANKQASSADKATATQSAMYNQTRADLQPYAQMGTQGIANYDKFMADPTAYLNTPAYQWQQQQIDKNMNRQLSARGRSNSTYGMNSLANAYGNLGAQEYQNAYQRVLDPIKIGQAAAAGQGNAATSYGNAAASAYNAQGANQAALYSGLGAMPMNALSAYQGIQNNQAMNNYLTKGGSSLYPVTDTSSSAYNWFPKQ